VSCNQHYDCHECRDYVEAQIEEAERRGHAAGKREGIEAAAKYLEREHPNHGGPQDADRIRALLQTEARAETGAACDGKVRNVIGPNGAGQCAKCGCVWWYDQLEHPRDHEKGGGA
jgi:hypothetical protein